MYIDYLGRIRQCDEEADEQALRQQRAEQVYEKFKAFKVEVASLPVDCRELKAISNSMEKAFLQYIEDKKEIMGNLLHEKNQMRLEMYGEQAPFSKDNNEFGWKK